MVIKKKIVLHFPHRQIDQPIVYHLVKDHDLQFNILKASITPEEEGLMVLEVTGKKDNYTKGIEYLEGCGIRIEPLSRDVSRNDEKCVQCGVCVPICPTGALSVDLETRKIGFDDAKCIACELCVRICPPRAMEVHF
jgi:ferredoxin